MDSRVVDASSQLSSFTRSLDPVRKLHLLGAFTRTQYLAACRASVVRNADAPVRQTQDVNNQPSEDEAQDRRALEAIVRRSLGNDQWPADALPPGMRVRVMHDKEWQGPWRDVFLGTIDRTVSPQVIDNAVARPGERADLPH